MGWIGKVPGDRYHSPTDVAFRSMVALEQRRTILANNH